jgi:hypothetical protein
MGVAATLKTRQPWWDVCAISARLSTVDEIECGVGDVSQVDGIVSGSCDSRSSQSLEPTAPRRNALRSPLRPCTHAQRSSPRSCTSSEVTRPNSYTCMCGQRSNDSQGGWRLATAHKTGRLQRQAAAGFTRSCEVTGVCRRGVSEVEKELELALKLIVSGSSRLVDRL